MSAINFFAQNSTFDYAILKNITTFVFYAILVKIYQTNTDMKIIKTVILSLPCILLCTTMTLAQQRSRSSQLGVVQELNNGPKEIKEVSKTFENPLGRGADPFIIKHNGLYYRVYNSRGGFKVTESRFLTRPERVAQVWFAPPSGPSAHQIWAPEIHPINGKWYIYAAGSDLNNGHYQNQRTFVLESDSPFGPYENKGVIYTGDDPEHMIGNRWAIDMTLFKHKNKLYAVWSGWEKAESTDNTVQHLYIARMKNPWTPASPRIRISSPDTEYECNGQLPINEGPEILKSPSQLFIVYSCGQSWLDTYKLSWLRLRDKNADPLKPESWEKSPTPVFSGTESIHGVGHACFTTSPDDKEHYIVYHSKRDVQPGWERDVRIQRFEFDSAGYPCFGRPVPTGEPQKLPSGSSDELK